jgi:hypothetical protein
MMPTMAAGLLLAFAVLLGLLVAAPASLAAMQVLIWNLFR